jgi:hypothetical protein
MGVDQHADHAGRFVGFDESHATHIRGQIVDFVESFNRLVAILFLSKIENQILRIREYLVPFVQRLDVYCTNEMILFLS